MPLVTCTLQVLCESVSPIGLLALRKDLSRNHELCCKPHLNNQLPPRSHNAENEIFSLHFTRHQRCSTDIPRQHFFLSSTLRLTRLCHLFLPAGQGPGKYQAEQWGLRKWEARVDEKEVPSRAEESEARKWWAEREMCRVGEQLCPTSLCAVCAWLGVTFTAVSVVSPLTGELGESWV